MTVTLASMSMKQTGANEEAPVPLKLFWGITFAVIAAICVVLGGIGGSRPSNLSGHPPGLCLCLADLRLYTLYGQTAPELGRVLCV